MLAKATAFLTNVRDELKKVTWPTRKETYGSTLVVIGLVVVVAVYLWLVDSVLSAAIRYLLK